MSGHNVHKVSSDALETLGSIIDEHAGRDAIHVAVEPMQAGDWLESGDDVGIKNGKAWSGTDISPVGIVDPFLKVSVEPGQWFWMLLYPRTITSLRHVWAHPAFGDREPIAPDKAASEAWLRAFCEQADCPGYDDVIAAAIGVNVMKDEDDSGYPGYYQIYNDGEYFHFGGRDAHGEIPPEFWDHVEIVTGVKIANRAKSFSCSC